MIFVASIAARRRRAGACTHRSIYRGQCLECHALVNVPSWYHGKATR